MKVIMIFDQIQSGLGTKDDTMLPLGGKKEAIGPAIMMSQSLKKIDAQVMACLYCGNGTYLADPDEVSRKLCAMVKKLNPDVVICGPAFNFADYAAMCAKVAADLKEAAICKTFAAMSEENKETIEAYKDKIAIVKTPKKGGMGLNDALDNMCRLAKALYDGEDTSTLEQEICFH